MRKMLFVIMIVLLSVAWVAAQQGDSASGQSSQSRPDQPGAQSSSPSIPANNGGQATSPAAPPVAPSADQAPMGNSQMIEGCLGGTAPDFTVTDQAGMVYKLDIPKDADTSQLTAHLGESVRVRGTVAGAGAAKSGSSAPESADGKAAAENAKPDNKPSGSASAAASQTIQVEQMSRGNGTCPADAAKPSSK